MTLLYLVPGSSLANGFWLWESFAKDTWSEFEGGAQKAGRGHSCHVEMLNNHMEISAKPTPTKREIGENPRRQKHWHFMAKKVN